MVWAKSIFGKYLATPVCLLFAYTHYVHMVILTPWIFIQLYIYVVSTFMANHQFVLCLPLSRYKRNNMIKDVVCNTFSMNYYFHLQTVLADMLRSCNHFSLFNLSASESSEFSVWHMGFSVWRIFALPSFSTCQWVNWQWHQNWIGGNPVWEGQKYRVRGCSQLITSSESCRLFS